MEIDMHEGLSPSKCPIRPAESPGRMTKYKGAPTPVKTKPERNHSPDQEKVEDPDSYFNSRQNSPDLNQTQSIFDKSTSTKGLRNV